MKWDYSIEEVRSWYEHERMPKWDWAEVAVSENKPVAFVAMVGSRIDQLFVHPDSQRRGIGSRLLSDALARGIRPLTLDVFEANAPARKLYGRFGFVETDRWYNRQGGAIDLRYLLA
jgi:putative acetyltransferase